MFDWFNIGQIIGQVVDGCGVNYVCLSHMPHLSHGPAVPIFHHITYRVVILILATMYTVCMTRCRSMKSRNDQLFRKETKICYPANRYCESDLIWL